MHPEFWHSLETVARIHNICRIVMVASAMLVAVAGFLDYVMGNRKDVLAAAVRREKISNLEKIQRPRKLSIDQQKDLVGLLARYKGRTVVVALHTDTEEAAQFRQQLIEVFKEASWVASGPHHSGQSREGLLIAGNVSNEGDPAQLLSESLQKARIRHRTEQNTLGELYISVGSKETTAP